MHRPTKATVVWFVVFAAFSLAARGQDKTTFTFHVVQVSRTGVILNVEGESATVKYKLSCIEKSKENTCYMPQASKDYQAKVAPNPEYIYIYGIVEGDAIFTIDAQQEKPREKK
jgi:hypothetical protein